MAEEFKVLIGGDISGLDRALNSATKKLSAFDAKVNKIANVGSKLAGLGRTLTASITLPIVGLGAAAVKSYGDIEALKLGLEAVAGSAELAEKQFVRLKEVAKLPGLGLEEAVRGAINLQAIGIEAERAENILMQFGNAVATVGKGRAEFERAIYGVQQLANTEFPLGEDLNIIKDALPQVNTLLKEAFGSARSDELAKMGVTSKQIVETITQGLSELPRVTGGVKGAFENLQDSLKISLGRVGKIINDNIDISGIVDKITSAVDKAVTAFEELSPTMQKVVLGITAATAAAGPLLVVFGGLAAMLPSLIAGVDALGTAFTFATGPIGLVALGVVGVVTAFVANWDKIKPYVVNFINYWRELYNESQFFRLSVQAIGFVFKGMYDIAKGVLVGIWDLIKSLAKGGVEVFAGLGDAIKGVFTLDKDLIGRGIVRAMQGSVDGISNAGKSIGKTFNNIINDINKSLDDLNVDKLELIKDIPSELSIKIPDLKEQENNVVSAVKNTLGNIKTKVENSVKAIVLEVPISIKTKADNILDIEKSFFNRMQSFKENLSNNIQSLTTDVAPQVDYLAETINQAASKILNEGVFDLVSNAAMSIGDALAEGTNVLSAVGQSMLGTLGGIMIDLGKIALKTAIGIKAIKLALKSLNPAAALAAGVALIAFGSLIRGAVSNLGGGSSSSVVSGSGYSGYSAPKSTAPTTDSYTRQEVKFRIEGRELVGVINNANQRNNRING